MSYSACQIEDFEYPTGFSDERQDRCTPEMRDREACNRASFLATTGVGTEPVWERQDRCTPIGWSGNEGPAGQLAQVAKADCRGVRGCPKDQHSWVPRVWETGWRVQGQVRSDHCHQC
jgi:hypothetical protein